MFTSSNAVISKKTKGRLTDQLYETFQREISCGRWTVGERLPSYKELSQKSGLSRTPIEAVLTCLEKEGYITKIKKKGIFLKSLHPGSHVSLGTIAVITTNLLKPVYHGKSQRTQSFGLWEIDSINDIAQKIGLNLEVMTLDDSPETDKSNFKRITSKADFKGVISMVQEETAQKLYDTNKIKTVYLGIEDMLCSPCVTGNPSKAMYMLTEHLVKLGHRDIAVFASSVRDPEVMQTILKGHKATLKKAGLKYNNIAVEKSLAIDLLDVAAVKDFMESCPETSAFIGTTVEASQKIIETADFMGIDIPGDISLCSMQVEYMRGNTGDAIDGIVYDWRKIIVTCFESLLSAEKFMNMSRIVFDPLLDLKYSTKKWNINK
jgi:GntR family transcriptional regulator, arabinose operon transcriptional repressor